MTELTSIEYIRQEIDDLDDKILELVNNRILKAQLIGKLKRADGDSSVYRPEREAQILSRLASANAGPLTEARLLTIFRDIISAARASEAVPCVASLGPAGTYSQAAVHKHFGCDVEHVFGVDINEVFRLTESGAADHGIVPVENSTEGGVRNTLDCLMATPLSIIGEVNLRISLSLLGCKESSSDAAMVLGHEQALAQCRGWLDRHLPNVERVSVTSNAEAARQASEDPKLLAVASSETAEIYDLNLFHQGIEDMPGNTTRFLVVSNEPVSRSGSDKTSLLISSRNQAGSLQRLLMPLSDNGISMSRIESRPAPTGLWEYVFFLDFEGHSSDDIVRKALKQIEDEAALFKVLGSYPRSV
tara:strand:+ start:2811 stop:3890 length:1080 start_codon:yes stop_codon:yes gene_type:complete